MHSDGLRDVVQARLNHAARRGGLNARLRSARGVGRAVGSRVAPQPMRHHAFMQHANGRAAFGDAQERKYAMDQAGASAKQHAPGE